MMREIGNDSIGSCFSWEFMMLAQTLSSAQQTSRICKDLNAISYLDAFHLRRNHLRFHSVAYLHKCSNSSPSRWKESTFKEKWVRSFFAMKFNELSLIKWWWETHQHHTIEKSIRMKRRCLKKMTIGWAWIERMRWRSYRVESSHIQLNSKFW